MYEVNVTRYYPPLVCIYMYIINIHSAHIYYVNKNFQTIQTLGRAWQGVNWSWSQHQESPRSDIFRKRATNPLLKQKHRQKHLSWAKEKKNWTAAQWCKVLFSDESKCCISFGNQGPRVWRKSGDAQNPCCLKSSVKFLNSVMIWAAMSSAGVGPLCFLKSTVNTAIFQEILEHFMLPSADKLYGDADFIFQQDLAPAHTAKGTKSWFDDHGILCSIGQQTRLTWYS